jgi:hypothetical protein
MSRENEILDGPIALMVRFSRAISRNWPPDREVLPFLGRGDRTDLLPQVSRRDVAVRARGEDEVGHHTVQETEQIVGQVVEKEESSFPLHEAPPRFLRGNIIYAPIPGAILVFG